MYMHQITIKLCILHKCHLPSCCGSTGIHVCHLACLEMPNFVPNSVKIFWEPPDPPPFNTI